MDIKVRMENVLHCYLNDEQIKRIKEDYKTFYENPENYENDGLTDIIIDDLKLTVITPWSAASDDTQSCKNPWDEVEAADNIDIKKIFPSNAGYISDDVPALAIGHVNHIPVYFRMLTDVSEFNYIGWTASYQHITDLSYKLHDHPNAQILRIYKIGTSAPSGYYIAYAYKVEYIHELNDVNACGKKDWEYIGDYPMTEDCRPACKFYVPFSEMANGGRIPVMWYNPMQNVKAITSGTLDKLTALSEVTEQDVHDIYNGIKEEHGSIDLDTHDDADRYVSLLMSNADGHDVFTYNRNHLSRNGAIAHGMAILPLLLVKEMKMTEPHHSSLYVILQEGNRGDIAYIGLYSEKIIESSINRIGEPPMYPSGKDRGQYESREYLDNHGSKIQQLLNQGTGDYKEADSND